MWFLSVELYAMYNELSERTFIFPFNEITLELNSNTIYVNNENDEMRSYKVTLYNQDFVLRN